MQSKKIKGRKHIKVSCAFCGEDVWKQPCRLKKYPVSYCSQKCKGFSEATRTGKIIRCADCNSEVYRSVSQIKKSKSGKLFCDRSCSTRYRNKRRTGDKHPNWVSGVSSYRKHALTAYGPHCSSKKCPIILAGIEIPVKMLDVDHIDENRQNNSLENLQVLCVWCHAEKTRKIIRD